VNVALRTRVRCTICLVAVAIFALSQSIFVYLHSRQRESLGKGETMVMDTFIGAESKPVWPEQLLARSRLSVLRSPAPSPHCNHALPCWLYAFVGTLRSMMIGFAVKSCLFALPQLAQPKRLLTASFWISLLNNQGSFFTQCMRCALCTVH
jgi:hypothetical protein